MCTEVIVCYISVVFLRQCKAIITNLLNHSFHHVLQKHFSVSGTAYLIKSLTLAPFTRIKQGKFDFTAIRPAP